MMCPYCECYESKVNDVWKRDNQSTLVRRRECLYCHNKYTTYEKLRLPKGIKNAKQLKKINPIRTII